MLCALTHTVHTTHSLVCDNKREKRLHQMIYVFHIILLFAYRNDFRRRHRSRALFCFGSRRICPPPPRILFIASGEWLIKLCRNREVNRFRTKPRSTSEPHQQIRWTFCVLWQPICRLKNAWKFIKCVNRELFYYYKPRRSDAFI